MQKFNAATDVARLADGASGAIDARETNLKPFFDRGGKLLQYHGWSDPQITPLASTQYYDRVVAAQGGAGKARRFLPFVHGARHGALPRRRRARRLRRSGALEPWVEQGKAPDAIIASHSRDGKVDRTRPLCPYPQLATYKGSGSIDDAANFVCR